jgi:hypothetical protein
MSVYAGPKIVTNGLVFYYDMGNTQKSWKGAPTINLLPQSTREHTGGVGSYWNGIINANNTEKGFPSFKITTVTNDRLDGFITSNGGNLTSGVVYTWSADVWVPVGKTIQIRMRAISGGGSVSGTATNIAGTNSWVRVSRTFTATTNTSGSIEGNEQDSVTDVYSFWIKNLQLEQQPFATPFVVGTRSATQSLIEMTGNRSITINSITTPSDGKFNFSSSNSNYMTLSSSVDIYNKSYTVSSWIKRTASNSYHGIIGDLQFNWFQFMITSSNKLYLRYGYYDNGEKKAALAGSTNIGLDYTNVVATYELGVGIKLYVNGVLDGTATYPIGFGLTGGSRGPRYIGRSDNSSFGTTPYFFNGEINILQFHNRALTTQEVQQNFNALKGRFGI